MRITQRRFILAASPVAALFLLRRGLLVIFLALKILGHPAALDAWTGAVMHRTTSYAGIPVDVYGNPESDPAMLIIHGVNPTGKNSLDLVRISEALAQTGYSVYVPDFAEMKRLHLMAEEAGHIKTVFRAIGRQAGIARLGSRSIHTVLPRRCLSGRRTDPRGVGDVTEREGLTALPFFFV